MERQKAHGKRGHRRMINSAERKIKALSLRKVGKSYREIARLLGYSQAQAARDVNQGLASLNAQETASVKELRRLELERFDQMQSALQARANDPKVSTTQLIEIQRGLLRIHDRRTRLLGLNAPISVHVMADVLNTLNALGMGVEPFFEDLRQELRIELEKRSSPLMIEAPVQQPVEPES
jgi:hypothetical protein